MGRVVATLLGLRRDPRHHDHPLLLLLGADLPDGLPRDQGRRGRRVHLGRRRDGLALRQGHLRPHPRHPQPAVRGGPGAHRRAGAGRPGLARPARGREAPRHLHRDGPDGRERRPAARASTARSSTSSAYAARTSPRRRSTTASGPTRSPRSPRPTAPWSAATTARAPASPTRRSPSSSRCSVPTAWSPPATAAPLNDGAAAVIIMSDTKAEELGLTPLARIVSTGVTGALPRDHGPRPGRGDQAGARSTPT